MDPATEQAFTDWVAAATDDELNAKFDDLDARLSSRYCTPTRQTIDKLTRQLDIIQERWDKDHLAEIENSWKEH